MSFSGSIKAEIYNKLDNYLDTNTLGKNDKLYVSYNGVEFSIGSDPSIGGEIPDRFLANYIKNATTAKGGFEPVLSEGFKANLKNIRKGVKPLAKIKNNIIAFFNKNAGCSKLEKRVLSNTDAEAKRIGVHMEMNSPRSATEYQMAKNILNNVLHNPQEVSLSKQEKKHIQSTNKILDKVISFANKDDEQNVNSLHTQLYFNEISVGQNEKGERQVGIKALDLDKLFPMSY